jgi:hypothetical protein
LQRFGRALAFTLCCYAASARAQGAQTEIDWLDEVAESNEDGKSSGGKVSATESVRAAPSQDGLRLRTGASLFSRYELRRNYDQLGVADERIHDMDAVAYRVRLLLRTEPLRISRGLSVDLAVVPQASGFWGPSGIDRDAALGLHEGYLRPRFGDHSWLQVGRFEMSYGDEWLIGANAWNETGRSFDGLRAHIQSGKSAAFFDVFGTLLQEGAPLYRIGGTDRRVGTGDQLLFGTYADLGPLLAKDFHLDFYALLLVAPRTNQNVVAIPDGQGRREAAAEGTLGLRVKGRAAILDYRLEGGVQLGDRVRLTDPSVVSDTLAGAVDAELGFNVQDSMRIAFNGSFASGDDPKTQRDESWADRYSQPHKWLGLSDVIRTRTNVLGPGAFLSFAPVANLDFGVQGHFLFLHRALDRSQETLDASFGVEYAGTEIDGYVGYGLGAGLYLRAEYAAFLPNDAAFGDHPTVHYLGVQFGFDYPG